MRVAGVDDKLSEHTIQYLFTSDEWNRLERSHHAFVTALSIYCDALEAYRYQLNMLGVGIGYAIHAELKEETPGLRLRHLNEAYKTALKKLAELVAPFPSREVVGHLDFRGSQNYHSENDWWFGIHGAYRDGSYFAHCMLLRVTAKCLADIKDSVYVLAITERVRRSALHEGLGWDDDPPRLVGDIDDAIDESLRVRGILAAQLVTWELQEIVRVAILDSVRDTTGVRAGGKAIEKQPGFALPTLKNIEIMERRKLVAEALDNGYTELADIQRGLPAKHKRDLSVISRDIKYIRSKRAKDGENT